MDGLVHGKTMNKNHNLGTPMTQETPISFQLLLYQSAHQQYSSANTLLLRKEMTLKILRATQDCESFKPPQRISQKWLV